MSQPMETAAAVGVTLAAIELVKAVVLRVLSRTNGNGNGSARTLLEVTSARQLQKIVDCSERMFEQGGDIEKNFEEKHRALNKRLDRWEGKIEKIIGSVVVCPLTNDEMERLVARLKGDK